MVGDIRRDRFSDRTGATWVAGIHLLSRKGSRTYFLDGGTARLPCFSEDDANPDTEEVITEWYEFEIPDWSGKVALDKKSREAFVRKPPIELISLDGQAPSGRPWHVEVSLREIFYVLFKRTWAVTFPMALGCEGGFQADLGQGDADGDEAHG